jgi:hypothetical protein
LIDDLYQQQNRIYPLRLLRTLECLACTHKNNLGSHHETHYLPWYSAIVLGICFSAIGIAAPADKNAPKEVIVINDGTNPVPVTSNAYRFVGFSTDMASGDAGIAEMQQTCQDSSYFGPEARMCTTK